ncbi:MAG: EamA family transporter [Burkholderiaceae bacterium]
MSPRITDYGYLLATVALTVYGQLAFKWRMQAVGALPDGLAGKFRMLVPLLFDPWILSGLVAAFLASLSWMVVLTRMPLSEAYPVTALTFVFVVLSGALIFREHVGPMQWMGLALVVTGLIVGTRV